MSIVADTERTASSKPGTQRMVGIAEMIISSNPTDILVAPNLGSCLGLAVYDPEKQIGGVIHCLLPLSKADTEKAKNNPLMYVDSGVSHFLNEIIKLGARKNKLVITAAGCSNINDLNNVFEIGKKNHTIFRKLMWKNNLLIKGEDVGESFARTLSLRIDTGEVTVRSQGNIKQLA